MARIAEWSQERYRLNKRFVNLTLMLNKDEPEQQRQRRAGAAAETSAAYAGIVAAPHESAKAFYRRHHFEECLDNPLRLFLPLHDIVALLEKLGAP